MLERLKKIRKHLIKCFGKYSLTFVLITVFFFLTTVLFYKMGYNNGRNTGKIDAKHLYTMIKQVQKEKSVKDLEMEVKLSAHDEKISGINTRFEDLYVLGGIILALLGIILVSVYVKTENDVDKHLSENFNSHKTEIERKVAEANELVATLQARLNMTGSMSNNPSGNSLAENDSTENGND